MLVGGRVKGGGPLPIYTLLPVFSKNSSPLKIYCVLTLVWAQYLHELFHLILAKKEKKNPQAILRGSKESPCYRLFPSHECEN